jgi:hypothetical protein
VAFLRKGALPAKPGESGLQFRPVVGLHLLQTEDIRFELGQTMDNGRSAPLPRQRSGSMAG